MRAYFRRSGLPVSALFLLLSACSSQATGPGNMMGASGSTAIGSGGTVNVGTGGNATAGSGTGTGTGTGGTAMTSGGAPTGGTMNAAGSGGTVATGGTSMGGVGGMVEGMTGGAGGAAMVGGAAGTMGEAGAAGAAADVDPPPPRPINITAGNGCNCDINTSGGKAKVDTTKPIKGKLVITLPGICGGPGGGGLEGTAIADGYHVFQPQTQSCVNSAPDMYKQMLQNDPMNAEANRQVGDARMELWDGVDRVDWVTVNPGESISERTLKAIQDGVTQDPGGDWGFYLNTDGTVRWTDVFVMGYSWGAQTAAMIASYVRFGRVFCASGPQAEQFPNADWITHRPWATPYDRLFMTVGFNEPYPSTDTVDTAPNTVTSMIDTVTKAGWIGPPVNVMPGDMGPYDGAHMFAAVAKFPYDAHSPGGHGIFCNTDPQLGWKAMCDYIFMTQ